MGRKSFILHIDTLDVLDELTDEQAAMLFRAIRDYQKGKEVNLSGLMKAVFVPFKNKMDAEREKYEKACERNKANGLRGGRPIKIETQKTQNNPLGFSETEPNPKNPDTDTDTDTDTDRKKKVKKKKNRADKPPDVEPDVWDDFLKHRKAKKAKVTATALEGIRREATKAGWSMNDALKEICLRGWQGFKADWVIENKREVSKGNANDELREFLDRGRHGRTGNSPDICLQDADDLQGTA